MSCESYEVLNVVTVVVVWVQTDNALGGNFWHYGSEVYGHYVNNDPEFDVMCNAFPTVVSLFVLMLIDLSNLNSYVKTVFSTVKRASLFNRDLRVDWSSTYLIS